MRTRTKNALGLGLLALIMAAGFGWLARNRQEPSDRGRALGAIPSGALLVADADLDALRASPLGAPLFKQGREIPGLGQVRDVCGFDPLDKLHQLALAVPATGDSGDFGLVGVGEIDGDALLACASKVIEARGGRPVTDTVGRFRTIRDGSLESAPGEIAVRTGDMVLLGAGAYLRAMIDAAEGRTPTVRASAAHSLLSREIGEASLRVTAVLTPEQRQALALELTSQGGATAPGASISAGGLSIDLGAEIRVHGVLLCDQASACTALAETLRKSRDERAADYPTRLLGVGVLLEGLVIEADGTKVNAHVTVPSQEAADVLERVLAVKGLRHPMPRHRGEDEPPAGAPSPDEVLHGTPEPSNAAPASPPPATSGK